LTRREPPFPTTIVCDLQFHRIAISTGGLLTSTLHYPNCGALPKAFITLMRILSLCPHANVGWPIRCDGEEIPSQHCCDCGAQRTYLLQPSVQKGPWKRPQLCSTYPLGIVSSSNARGESASVGGAAQVSRCEQTRDAVSSNLVADGIRFA
jgi:hypothetical protein